MNLMLERVQRFVGSRSLVSRGDAVVCAVSGGVDSMVMLDLLWRLSRRVGFSLHVAHFDHRLRGGEGALDADLVRRTARDRGLSFSGGAGDVQGYMQNHPVGLEEAARILRYRFLFGVMEDVGAPRLATAHHADDQVETVFLRLLRGTGLKGLAGIPPIDGRGVIRPLLCARKHELVEYARVFDIPFREDATNREPVGPRNAIRNQFLAALEESERERLAGSVSELTASIAELNISLDRAIEKAVAAVSVFIPDAETKLDLKKLKSYHYIVRNGVYRFAYRAATGCGKNLTRKATKLLADFCESGRNGSEMHLPGGIRVYQEYGYAVFVRGGDSGSSPLTLVLPENIDMGKEYVVGDERCRLRLKLERTAGRARHRARHVRPGWGNREAVFDYEQLAPPLTVRSWTPGDRFEPFGLGGTRSLSDLLQEQRVPRRRRNLVPLLADGNRILWVIGVRRSAHAPVGAGTRQVLTVRVEKSGEGREKQ